MSVTQDDVIKLNRALANISSHLQSNDEQRAEHQARLQAIEQLVAKQMNAGSYHYAGSINPLSQQITDALRENAAFASLKEWNQGTSRVTVAADIRAALTHEGAGSSSSGGYPGEPDRSGIVMPAMRSLRLIDVLPSRPTNRDLVTFVQMNASGDASEQILEGDEKAEIDLEGELASANIATIAAHTTASRQVLDDEPALNDYIDTLLRYKVSARLDHQLLNGPGGEGKINGLINQATPFIPTIGASAADIIGEALTRQSNNGYQPNLVIMNPLDWLRLQITKTATTDEYLFGSPTAPVQPSLWNTTIVRTPSCPEGTALTLDTGYITLLDRQKPGVLLSNSHKDYFTRNLLLILGELRAGLEVRDTWAIYSMDLVAPSA